MKNTIGILLLILLGFISCSTQTATSRAEKAKDTRKTSNKKESKEIFGIVLSIENGKDGYTAEIKTPNNEIYFATISIPNLGENGNYQRLEIGNKVAVAGNVWMLGNDKQITVRNILSANTDNFKVEGIVKSIKSGMDGYTAKIETPKGEFYVTTISIPNLGRANSDKFKQFEVGENLSVVGELWGMGDEKHVTVRDILPASE